MGFDSHFIQSVCSIKMPVRALPHNSEPIELTFQVFQVIFNSQ